MEGKYNAFCKLFLRSVETTKNYTDQASQTNSGPTLPGVAGARRTDSLLALIALFLFHRALKSMNLIWGLEGRQVICSFTEGTEA